MFQATSDTTNLKGAEAAFPSLHKLSCRPNLQFWSVKSWYRTEARKVNSLTPLFALALSAKRLKKKKVLPSSHIKGPLEALPGSPPSSHVRGPLGASLVFSLAHILGELVSYQSLPITSTLLAFFPIPLLRLGEKANPDRAGVGEGWASGFLKTACGSLTHHVYQADESVFKSAFPSMWVHMGVPP